ncbi:MAG: hypothetical protein B7Y02_10150 [Rhodobacterales bacterium 17-64-5]|nr:MAG: hypothetical protein B7Y02_10150 [Rhodobacterales bacterium 17-64-5]
MRAYASLSLDNAEAARAIWRRITKGELPQPFTARDVQRKGWAGLTDAERLGAGLKALREANRIRAVKVETGGRPSVTFHVNPKALRS